MPDLTTKQQAFAQAIANGTGQTEAYRQIYDAQNQAPGTVHTNAFNLVHSANVALRITELQTALQERQSESWAWTYQKVMDEIAENLRLARLYKQLGPARACVRDAAELSGLWKEKKSESDVPIIKQTIILQARPAAPGLPTVDAEYQVLEPSEPADTVESSDC